MTRLVSRTEIAEVLGVSTRTVRRLVAVGVLLEGTHYLRVGHAIRFRADRVLGTLAAGRQVQHAARAAVSDAILADLE